MEADKWWSTWAPVWEHIEDRHFGTKTAESLIGQIRPEVLVVGAGQGLIVRYLKDTGISAVGLDINPRMVRIAKEKYGLGIIEGDAGKLPFNDASYNSVIISSGVVDYGADESSIKRFIEEALRVCREGGHVFVAFYRVIEPIEKIYRRIGVIDRDSVYRMTRIFEINELAEKNPLLCMKPIRRWTGKSRMRVGVEWAIVGLTRPKEFMTERKWINNVFQSAAEKGITRRELLDSVPDRLPYWTRRQIEELMDRIQTGYSDIRTFDDCTVIVLRK
ncbi:MAG: class I SAM-dependent methyltransferase [Spirochaetes bacterium]|nr:class I SAM-dependent methyltransferase [Spirochaetota bacterium]